MEMIEEDHLYVIVIVVELDLDLLFAEEIDLILVDPVLDLEEVEVFLQDLQDHEVSPHFVVGQKILKVVVEVVLFLSLEVSPPNLEAEVLPLLEEALRNKITVYK